MIPAGALKGGVAVVIDVLRATTTMIHGLAAGCAAIIPCGEIDEAQQVAASLPEGTALLAGEREGVKIDGFDIGNSPGECTVEACAGKTMVMTTTNGTRAILASLEADRVFVAAFVNATATIEVLKTIGRPVHLVCAGTSGEVSLEDSLFAGFLAQTLDTWAWEEAETKMSEGIDDSDPDLADTILANDSAEIAASLWRETEAMMEEGYALVDALSDGKGGRRVVELGLGDDLDDTADIDRFGFAAELLRDPLRIVPVDKGGPKLRLVGY
jgi:2-phosphosulfolactate phosphatase